MSVDPVAPEYSAFEAARRDAGRLRRKVFLWTAVVEGVHSAIRQLERMFPVGVPLGEAVPADKPQPPRERLVLVCLPPGEIIQEGDRVMVSDPRSLDRPPQASRMPLEVLTVPDDPRLLLPQELDSLAWAASEDREALVGEVLKPPSPEKN